MPLICLSLKIFFFFLHASHIILFTGMRSQMFVQVIFTGNYNVVYFRNKSFTLMCFKMTFCKSPESNVNHLTCKMFTSAYISIKVRTPLYKFYLRSSQSKSFSFLCMLRLRLNFETI